MSTAIYAVTTINHTTTKGKPTTITAINTSGRTFTFTGVPIGSSAIATIGTPTTFFVNSGRTIATSTGTPVGTTLTEVTYSQVSSVYTSTIGTTTTQSGFDFSISVSPSSSSVTAGKALSPAGTVSLGLVRGTPNGVSLSLSGLPSSVGTEDISGYSCSAPCSKSFGIGTLTGAAVGTYTLTITGTGGGKTHTTTYSLTVR